MHLAGKLPEDLGREERGLSGNLHESDARTSHCHAGMHSDWCCALCGVWGFLCWVTLPTSGRLQVCSAYHSINMGAKLHYSVLSAPEIALSGYLHSDFCMVCFVEHSTLALTRMYKYAQSVPAWSSPQNSARTRQDSTACTVTEKQTLDGPAMFPQWNLTQNSVQSKCDHYRIRGH